MSPSIGSAEYRALSFRDQLEITALKLFDPGKYEELHEGIVKKKDPSGQTWTLPYPPLPDDLDVADLPISVLRNYWAGYSCLYNAKWYAEDYKGLTPLDDYGIDAKKMVNIWTFTLPLFCVDPAVHYAFLWLAERYQSTSRIHLVISAAKVYLNLYMRMLEDTSHDLFKGRSTTDPRAVVKASLMEYNTIFNFVGLNNYCPIVEECHELTWFEVGEFSLYEKPRQKGGKWFYPLIPAGLFTAPNFSIKTWQFLK